MNPDDLKELLQYVNPKGPLPNLVGTKSGKNLLIMGTAACVFDDLDKYDDTHGEHDRMGVNDMIFYYRGQYGKYNRRLQHGAGLHPEFLRGWAVQQELVAAKQGGRSIFTHSIIPCNDHPTHIWPIHRDGGTTGLFGVLIGLLMGYDKIILAGSPVDDSNHFYQPDNRTYRSYGVPSFEGEWLRARDAVFKGKVKSLSGNTREWLGEP